MSRHTIRTSCIGVCPDLDLTVFSEPVTVHYTVHPATGDGWNEPHEAQHAEFEYALVGPGKTRATGRLLAWAEQWFGLQDQEELCAAADPDPDAARERREARETVRGVL